MPRRRLLALAIGAALVLSAGLMLGGMIRAASDGERFPLGSLVADTDWDDPGYRASRESKMPLRPDTPLATGPSEQRATELVAGAFGRWVDDNQDEVTLRLREAKPRLTAYQVVAFAPKGRGQSYIAMLEVDHGCVVAPTSMRQVPATRDDVPVFWDWTPVWMWSEVRPRQPQSPGEKEATDAALRWMQSNWPDYGWGAGISGYVYSYELGSDSLLFSMSPDGGRRGGWWEDALE